MRESEDEFVDEFADGMKKNVASDLLAKKVKKAKRILTVKDIAIKIKSFIEQAKNTDFIDDIASGHEVAIAIAKIIYDTPLLPHTIYDDNLICIHVELNKDNNPCFVFTDKIKDIVIKENYSFEHMIENIDRVKNKGGESVRDKFLQKKSYNNEDRNARILHNFLYGCSEYVTLESKYINILHDMYGSNIFLKKLKDNSPNISTIYSDDEINIYIGYDNDNETIIFTIRDCNTGKQVVNYGNGRFELLLNDLYKK